MVTQTFNSTIFFQNRKQYRTGNTTTTEENINTCCMYERKYDEVHCNKLSLEHLFGIFFNSNMILDVAKTTFSQFVKFYVYMYKDNIVTPTQAAMKCKI